MSGCSRRRDMGERLRKVAEERAVLRIDFLRKEPEIAAIAHERLEAPARLAPVFVSVAVRRAVTT